MGDKWSPYAWSPKGGVLSFLGLGFCAKGCGASGQRAGDEGRTLRMTCTYRVLRRTTEREGDRDRDTERKVSQERDRRKKYMQVGPELRRRKTQQENTRRDHTQGREAGKLCRALEMPGSPPFSLPLTWMLEGCSSKGWVHTRAHTHKHAHAHKHMPKPQTSLLTTQSRGKCCSERLSQENTEAQGRVAVSPKVPRIRRRNLERGPK